jgi:tousled-like kinase
VIFDSEEGASMTEGATLVAAATSAGGNTILAPKKPTSVPPDGAVSTSKPSESMSRELGHYKRRCLDLEGALADRDEKLRAVSNNQTMIHASLRATLDRREEEVNELRNEMEEKTAAVSETIEKLVRSDAARQAVELRQKLASDGARLGRIVYTRAGMHSVESWEDGQAPRALNNRRKEQREKREELERRQETALAVANKFRAQAASANGEDKAGNESRMEPVGGIVVQDAFDVMEALESIRLHIANLKKEEEELEEEEKALIAEKDAHIRALKRVASEDSSRFKHRPKLHDRYVPICQLGKGGFSEVWRAYDLEEMREVAVKIHQLDPRWSDAKKENYTKHVSREYEIHRDVRHPRIVSLFDVFEIDPNSFATVLECCEGTDLDTILKESKFLPERDARAYLLQILSGMRYLSSPSEDGKRQGIIHYDLKPGNILFDRHGDAKITDFGLSKIVDAPEAGDSMELTSQGAGTYWYLPPECFLTHQGIRISNKVDVWSIGVIFYQMLFGRRPFGDGQSQDHILTNNIMLNARDVRFPPSPQVSEGAKDFVRQCLTYDQTFRPNISQLCSNPYLQQDIQ